MFLCCQIKYVNIFHICLHCKKDVLHDKSKINEKKTSNTERLFLLFISSYFLPPDHVGFGDIAIIQGPVHPDASLGAP